MVRSIHVYVATLALALVAILSITSARPGRAAVALPPPASSSVTSPDIPSVPAGWSLGGTTQVLGCKAGWICCKYDVLGNCLRCAQHGC